MDGSCPISCWGRSKNGHNCKVQKRTVKPRTEPQWRVPATERATLNAGVSNLLDDDFQLYPGQEPAGRRFYASLTYAW